MTGSYQLMEPYMPMPGAIKRIVKNEVWQDDEYSDVEAKESEVEVDDSDDDQPVYKPRGCKWRGVVRSNSSVNKKCAHGIYANAISFHHPYILFPLPLLLFYSPRSLTSDEERSESNGDAAEASARQRPDSESQDRN